ncbi:MAG: hypothetical protein QXN23_06610 [Candidatus Caldarchaeum sp.]
MPKSRKTTSSKQKYMAKHINTVQGKFFPVVKQFVQQHIGEGGA